MATIAEIRAVRTGLWQARHLAAPWPAPTLAERFERIARERYRGQFREEDHPRDEGGKFSDKAHGEGNEVSVQPEEGGHQRKGGGGGQPTTASSDSLPEPLAGAFERLRRGADRPGEAVGPATLQDKEGRQAWAWMIQHRDDPRVEVGKDGKWSTLTFHGEDGDLWMRQPAASGLPFPAQFKPAAKPAPKPEAKPAAEKPSEEPGKQKTMFPGIRPEAGKPAVSPGQQQQRELFPKSELQKRYGSFVRQTKDGRLVGESILHRDQLSVDPERFQYKIVEDKTRGVNEDLDEVARYDPDLGGRLLVWHDPADGKDYVINGHHRYSIAARSPFWEEDEGERGWQGEMPCRFIAAKDAKQARAIGALANIAEGQGKPVDAAKFMRDTGFGIADLRKHNISMKRDMAIKGATLAKLSEGLFKKLVDKELSEERAMAIAAPLMDRPEAQDEVYRAIVKKEAKLGKDKELPRSVIREMAEDAAASSDITEKQKVIWGSEEWTRNTLAERGMIKAALRADLGRELATWEGVAVKGRSERLAGAGNVLAEEENHRRLQEMRELVFAFDRLKNSKGELADAIRPYTEELARARTATQQRAVIQRAIAAAREGLRTAVGRGEGGGPEGSGPMPQGPVSEAYAREGLVERFQRAWAVGRLSERFARAWGQAAGVERYAGQFDEQKHPRGNQKNPGQFAPKGQGHKGGGGDQPAEAAHGARPAGGAPSQEKPAAQPAAGSAARPAAQPAHTPTQFPAHLPAGSAGQQLGTDEENRLPDKVMHHYGDEASAMAAAKDAQPGFDAALRSIGQGLKARVLPVVADNAERLRQLDAGLKAPGTIIMLAPTKTAGSSERKVAKLDGDWRRMTDLVRGSVGVDNLAEVGPAVRHTIDQMATAGYKLVTRPRNYFAAPQDCGYRDSNMRFQAPNGLVVEVQVHVKSMLWAKEVGPGHALYEKRRAITEPIEIAKRKRTPEEDHAIYQLDLQGRKLYDPIWQQALDREKGAGK